MTIDLKALIDEVADGDFFNYKGGLTTPACYEVVTWFVFQQPIKISRTQVRKLCIDRLTLFITLGHHKVFTSSSRNSLNAALQLSLSGDIRFRGNRCLSDVDDI